MCKICLSKEKVSEEVRFLIRDQLSGTAVVFMAL